MKCARCGEPAKVRIGIDLVEPDSGTGACEGCAEVVRAALACLITGDEVMYRELMKIPRTKRKRRAVGALQGGGTQQT